MFSQYDHLKGIDHSIGKTLNMKKYKHLFTISNYKLIETKCENAQKTFHGLHIVKITKNLNCILHTCLQIKLLCSNPCPFIVLRSHCFILQSTNVISCYWLGASTIDVDYYSNYCRQPFFYC
jgi:hypothetical protein